VDTAAAERLDSTSTLVTRDSVFAELGDLVRMRFWYIAHRVSSDTVRIGIISLAQAVRTVDDSLRPDYLAVPENLVRTAKY